MVIIDRVINNFLGGLTLDPAGMHCPSWDDAFVSSRYIWNRFVTRVHHINRLEQGVHLDTRFNECTV